MAILGRILQFVGWLWVAASFFGNFIDIPDFGFGFFPGLILVFVSRVLRTQAKRQQRAEDADPAETTPQTPAPRPLYTERSKQTAEPAKKSASGAPKKSAPVTSQVVWPKDESVAEPEREDVIEKILVAGSDLAEQKTEDVSILEPTYDGKPLTSAEMIARARQRWDRKP